MPEGFLSLIVTMLPAFREVEHRLDRETDRRFNAFNLFAMNENATSRILVSTAAQKCARWRRKGVPVWLREKDLEALACLSVAARIEAREARLNTRGGDL
jgi:hypothetical protein